MRRFVLTLTSDETQGHLRRTLGLIFGVAFVLRLLVFLYIVSQPHEFFTYDSDGYFRRAMNLLRYGVFASQAQPPLTPDLDRTPLYPAFLASVFAVVGPQPAAAVLLQLLAGSVTAVLVYVLARELKLSTLAGSIGALIIAVDPVSLMTANRLLTETLFTMLLVMGVWLLVRYWRTRELRWLLLSAVAIALTALTRPISQFLPLALLPLFALAGYRQRLRAMMAAGLLFVALSMLLTYTWAYRNYRTTGVFTLSVISDINLIYYRARAVLAAAEGTSQDEAWAKLREHINTTAAQQNLTISEKIALERREALAIFRQHPGLTLVMLGKGVARFYADPGFTITCTLLDGGGGAFDCFPGEATMNNSGVLGKVLGKFPQFNALQQFTLIWSTLLLGITYAGAAIGLVRLVRERRWLTVALLFVTVGYFLALSAGAETDSRFRIPTMPFLALIAGVGVEGALGAYQNWLVARRRITLAQEQV